MNMEQQTLSKLVTESFEIGQGYFFVEHAEHAGMWQLTGVALCTLSYSEHSLPQTEACVRRSAHSRDAQE